MIKKKKIIIFVITLLCISTLTIAVYCNKKIKDNNTNTNISDNNSTEKEVIESAKEIFSQGNASDVIMKINGEEITQLDYNNQKFINENTNKKIGNNILGISNEEILKEITIRKILLKQAEENQIDIDNEEKEIINNMYKSANKEVDKEIAQKMNLSIEEYTEYAIKQEINSRKISKMKEKVITQIINNEIQINDVKYNTKVKEFHAETNDLQKRTILLQEAYDLYIEYLINNSNIENINNVK